MAYKSRVTNKYMGSTFAGRVNPGRENELTQLARSLDDFTDAVPKGIAAYAGKQIDAAEERLEELRTTMTPEELNAYILKGEDKILANKWAVSVVDGQLGRFAAADAINNIVAANDQYDYTTGNRREFYKQFLPDFGSKSSAFKNGFGVHFNDWQSRDLYNDATNKAQFRQDSKIREGVKFLDTVQYEDMDEFYAIAQSLNSQLPSTDGEKNYFFTNEDINETIIRLAEFTISKPNRTVDDYDKALSYLTGDRGTAANGTKLGSLASTAREDVNNLINKIEAEKFTFVTQDYRLQQYKEDEQLRNLTQQALSALGTENEFDTYKEFRDKIADISFEHAQSLDALYKAERNIDVDPGQVEQFSDEVLYGAYNGDFYGMVDAMRLRGIPMTYLDQMAKTYELANKKELTGEPFIFDSNETYLNEKSLTLQDMIPNFTAPGEMAGDRPVRDTAAYNAASSAAIRYMNRAILAFEASFEGTPNNLDRLNFMGQLNAQVLRMFKMAPAAETGGEGTFIRPRESDVLANPEFFEVSQELINEPTTLANVLEGVVQGAPRFRPQGTPDAIAEDFPQQIAQDIINNLPAFMSNNLQLFIASLRPGDVKRLQDAYNLQPEQIDAVLKIIQGN